MRKKEGIRLGIQVEEKSFTTWQESLRERWLNRDALKSYGVSLISHLIVAVLLSLVVFRPEIKDLGFSTLLSMGTDDGQGVGLDETGVFQIEPPGGQTGPELDTMLAADSLSKTLGSTLLRDPSGFNMGAIGGAAKGGGGEGEGTGKSVGDGLDVGGNGGFRMPEGGRVVRKGSFTAWTVPADPKPHEDYKIVIQVQYKNAKQKLNKNDVTGTVIGTDSFKLAISRHTATYIPEANQVVVEIPGAEALVRDRIRVFSAILRESQQLEIEF